MMLVDGAREDKEGGEEDEETEGDFDKLAEVVAYVVQEGGVERAAEVDGFFCWDGEQFDVDGRVAERRGDVGAKSVDWRGDEGVECGAERVEGWDRVVERGERVEDCRGESDV
jgi:hypothetical protein